MLRRGRLIAIEGASASGKTALIRAAARALRWYPLHEAYDRLDPSPSLQFRSSSELLLLEGTLLSEETHRFRDALDRCGRGRTVIADTGFFGPLTYTWGLVALGRAPEGVGRSLSRSARSLVRAGLLGLPDLTVYLRTTVSERHRRARKGANEHPASLVSRHEAVGRVERRYFCEVFPTLFPARFRTLRGDVPPERLVPRLRAIAEECPASPPTRADALRLLSCLPRREPPERRPGLGPNR